MTHALSLFRVAFVMATLASIAPAAIAEIAARPGLIWDVAARAPITRQALEERLATTSYVLLGEKHDNPWHHELQGEIIDGLVKAGRRPSLVWEMLPRAKQPALDGVVAQADPSPDAFAETVGWASLGWGDWSLFRPIAAAAIAGRLPQRAAGLDRSDVRAVARNGLPALPPDLSRGLPAGKPLSESQRRVIEDAVYHGHCGFMPRDRLGPMISVQIARDLALADAVARSEPSDGAVLIAGAQHVRLDAGAPVHLARMRPDASVISISFVEAAPGSPPNPLDLARTGSHDYFWFTRPGPAKDYCGDLAKRFGMKSKPNPKP